MKSFDRFVLRLGNPDSPILKNILLKKKLLSSKNPLHKKIKIGLIIGGGGMRSAFAGGVLSGLKNLGLSDVFDLVVGVSAGAPIGAYFLSDQAEDGSSIYTKYLARKEFIDPFRLSKIIDIGYMDRVFRKHIPLDQNKIRKSRSDFYVTVTDVNSAKGELLNMKDKKIDIVDAICASSALPILYNGTVRIKGKDYCDGALGNGVPIEFAVRKGCTDILIVLSNSSKRKNKNVHPIERLAINLYMKSFSQDLKQAMLDRNKLYNHSLDSISKFKNVNISLIVPDKMPLKRMSTDKKKIEETVKMGKEMTFRLFPEG